MLIGMSNLGRIANMATSKETTKKTGSIAIIVIIIAAIIAGAAYYYTTLPTGPQTTTAATVEIPIGALVDLSGPLTTYGEDIRNALQIGNEEINSYFESKGMPYKVTLYIEDTKVDPKIALDKVQTLDGKGVKLIVGPMGSGEVKQIAEYVTANKMIIISPSSTAVHTLLGVTKPEEKKYIFRFVATDAFQTEAIAKEASELGIKGVVITYIGNAWGKGLNDYATPKFETAGIEVSSPVEYSDPPPTDFTPYIAIMEGAVSKLINKYGSSSVAVVAFSYEEVYTMLTQVNSQSPLLKVRWLGCDGTAKSRRINDIPDKVNKVGMYSTLFDSKGPSFDKLNKTYHERFGRDIYQYALDAYDAEWVLALSFSEIYGKLGKYDADEMAANIPTVTEKYSNGEYGVTTVSGYIKLDEFNDRASGDYAIWGVENAQWVLKGIWRSQTNQIEWQ
jgi:branched-chain amino acid transport system substrate-binding protein